jgi:hypothetical protein
LNKLLVSIQNHDSKTNVNNTGLLAQLHALSRIGSRDFTLREAHLLIGALFFLIEILPVLIKVLMNLGPLSAYDIAAKASEEEFTEQAKARRIELRRMEEGKSRTRLNIEEDMRQREEALGKQANEHVASEMTGILDLALAEWSEQVHARLAGPSRNLPTQRKPADDPHVNGHAPVEADGSQPGALIDLGKSAASHHANSHNGASARASHAQTTVSPDQEDPDNTTATGTPAQVVRINSSTILPDVGSI